MDGPVAPGGILFEPGHIIHVFEDIVLMSDGSLTT